jgi:PIN domain
MTLTYILVDFENVQPSAADIGLVRGDGVRLCIFRGPGQTKYSADVAEAWQPLGASVTFIRCAKAGRNAVDMHIAFYLGELVAAQDRAAAGKGARFVVVSRDTDFDPLLMHVRSHGYSATRVASLKAALEGNGAEPAEPKAAKKRATRAAPAAREKTEKTEKAAAAKAPAAKKSAGRKAPAKKSAAAPAAAKKTAAPARAPARPASDAIAKVIASLQKMGDKRPSKRARLERHIESHLGRKMEPGQLAALMEQLERDGVLVFDDNKVEYRLPKAKK